MPVLTPPLQIQPRALSILPHASEPREELDDEPKIEISAPPPRQTTAEQSHVTKLSTNLSKLMSATRSRHFVCRRNETCSLAQSRQEESVISKRGSKEFLRDSRKYAKEGVVRESSFLTYRGDTPLLA